MRIVGSSAMSREVLWRVSGSALKWRKRFEPAPGSGHVAAVPEPGEVGGEPGQLRRQGGPGQVVEGEWSWPPGGVGEVKVQHVRGPGV